MNWIAANDKLPKPGKDVLVCHHRGQTIHMSVKYFVQDDGLHAWGWYPGGMDVQDTYWAKLPAGPKKERKKR